MLFEVKRAKKYDFFKNLSIGTEFIFNGQSEANLYKKITRQKVRNLNDGREFHFHPRAVCQLTDKN